MNIAELKRLAGIDTAKPQAETTENMSHTAQALKDKERKLGIKPGDADWFKLWFSKPYMTGSVDTKFRGRKK
jgi:hypothetical protein